MRGARRAAGGHRSRHQCGVGRREEPPKPAFPETQPPCSRRDPLGPRSPGLRAMGLPLPRLRPTAGTPRCSQPRRPTARLRCSRLDQPLRRPCLQWAGRWGQFPWAPLDSGMSPSPRAIPGQDDGPETDHSHTGQGQGLRPCLGHWAAPAILTCSLLCAPGSTGCIGSYREGGVALGRAHSRSGGGQRPGWCSLALQRQPLPWAGSPRARSPPATLTGRFCLCGSRGSVSLDPGRFCAASRPGALSRVLPEAHAKRNRNLSLLWCRIFKTLGHHWLGG